MRTILRSLARTPAFSLATTLLLALGIGSAALFFSAYDAVILRSIPAAHPEQLVHIAQLRPVVGVRSSFPYLYYTLLRDRAQSIEVFGEAPRQFPLTAPDPPEELRVREVTPEFFEALGVPAMLGRYLTRAGDVPSTGTPAAVLSYRFWQRRFLSDPGAIGQTLAIDGVRFAITGVMPPGFNGISADFTPDVRIPIWTKPLVLPNTGGLELMGDIELSARLRPGATRERAFAEASALYQAAINQLDPGPHDFIHDPNLMGLRVVSLTHGVSIVRDKFGSALSLLTATAALLLVMVCLNLAGLMMARAAARRQDIAVRMARSASALRWARSHRTSAA